MLYEVITSGKSNRSASEKIVACSRTNWIDFSWARDETKNNLIILTNEIRIRRITSYNVCYTKLLRLAELAKVTEKKTFKKGSEIYKEGSYNFV